MKIFEADSQNYDDQLKKAEYVMVDFYGDHCGACMYTEPFLRDAANEMCNIHFVKINITKNPEIGERYKIYGVPTFYFFHNGEIVHRCDGGKDREKINENIGKLLYD